ncbi:MAG: 2-C-methyl-D-erythritol 2,4-cyclodiphosphate synthase [Clostridiales Family XIII bacterium]|jgi:2-C-methyl-D-erythritol 2,4-cyclodiphosphate synthase/2-C-methyl-D-erythritol 4-phosphate cytidylyltransferase|nr:2-C-methyl-D-erythritol 2,4-cyclodiphosphate synthase [Clostridiales Family XIII bacterium]
MYANKRIAAIIVAAGAGTRMKTGLPKQYISVGGRPVLVRAIEAFEKTASIDDVYIIADKMWITHCCEILDFDADAAVVDCEADAAVVGRGGGDTGGGAVGSYGVSMDGGGAASAGSVGSGRRFTKIRQIIEGGDTRQESVYAGLKSLPGDTEIVLIHDAARPFVSVSVVDKAVKGAVLHGAVVAAVPLTDTVKSTREGMVTGTLDRLGLYAAQTPQAFRRELIAAAHERAIAEDYTGTDDAVLIELMGEKAFLIEGEYNNIKLTTPEDLIMGEAIAADIEGGAVSAIAPVSRETETPPGLPLTETSAIPPDSEYRTGIGFDVHRFVEGRKFILGGVDIPFDRGLDGHSDADVLTHALMDAMLGAAALGDIGKLFPDTDDAYRGISSIKLLARTADAIREAGYELINADMTVILEKPKISSFTNRMAENLAAALKADRRRISIKATTTEGLGFTGKGEGAAAQAVVTLICRTNREPVSS